MWLQGPEMRKIKGEVQVGEQSEFSLGHVDFEMPLRLSREKLAVNTSGEILI